MSKGTAQAIRSLPPLAHHATLYPNVARYADVAMNVLASPPAHAIADWDYAPRHVWAFAASH